MGGAPGAPRRGARFRAPRRRAAVRDRAEPAALGGGARRAPRLGHALSGPDAGRGGPRSGAHIRGRRGRPGRVARRRDARARARRGRRARGRRRSPRGTRRRSRGVRRPGGVPGAGRERGRGGGGGGVAGGGGGGGAAVLFWPTTRGQDGDWYVQPPGPSPLAGALAGIAWDSLPPAASLVELAPDSVGEAAVVLTARLARRGPPRALVVVREGGERNGTRRATLAATGLYRW